MKVTKHPFGFNYKDTFEKLEIVKQSPGCVTFKGSKNGKLFLIIDCGTLADLLDENEKLRNELIEIYEFYNETELLEFINNRGINV